MRRTSAAAVALTLAVGVLAGCGGDPRGERGYPTNVAVYVDVPLRGPWAGPGQAIAHGAELAVADAGGGIGAFSVRLTERDITDDADGAAITQEGAVREAGTALVDQGALAMVSGLDPAAVRVSRLLASQTGLGFVTASGPEELGGGGRPGPSTEDLSVRGPRRAVRLAASDRAIAARLDARVDAAGCRSLLRLVVGDGRVVAAGNESTGGDGDTADRGEAGVAGSRTEHIATAERYDDPGLRRNLERRLSAGLDCLVIDGVPAAGDPAVLLQDAVDDLGGVRIFVTRGAASGTMAGLVVEHDLQAEAIVDDAAPDTDAETRRIDALHRRYYATPAPAGVISGWRSLKLLIAAVGAAGDDGNRRDAVAAKLVQLRVPGPPTVGTQDADGAVTPAPVGLARARDYGWRVVRNLAP
ncbi:MAG: hypothetical protein AB7G37_14250 [Solirubrobacteraceae bacterium]